MVFDDFLLDNDGVFAEEEVQGLVVIGTEQLAGGEWILVASFPIFGRTNFGDVLDEGLVLVILHKLLDFGIARFEFVRERILIKQPIEGDSGRVNEVSD